MNKKVFPIRTATACQLKWNWSTLYLYNGNTASCHRTGWDTIKPDTFNTFHNTDKKQLERTDMLNGRWPADSCHYCAEVEKDGGFSDRLLHLDIPDQYPPELDFDPTAVNVTPRILEVYFNNTCNLACLYCVPFLSSKINQENQKHGVFSKGGVELTTFTRAPEYSIMIEKFWQWMENNSHQLKRLNVLGGEPFYQPEFDRCLDYLESKRHTDLELCVITNLMIPKSRLIQYIERLKNLLAKRKLKRVDITCSVDCIGPEQEYVRYGMNMSTWFENFEYLLSNQWLTININQTISVLTIKTMPGLVEHLQQYRKQHAIGHFFSEVTPQPSYLMPNILGHDVFVEDFKKVLSHMPDDNAKKYMQSIADHINRSEKNLDEMKKLKIFLDEKDRRRGTNWQTTFPWLMKELDNVV